MKYGFQSRRRDSFLRTSFHFILHEHQQIAWVEEDDLLSYDVPELISQL